MLHVCANPDAVKQSNLYACGKKICEPLVDGFQEGGARCLIKQDGTPWSGGKTLVASLSTDEPLRRFVNQSVAEIKELPIDDQVNSACRLVSKYFATDKDPGQWYDNFRQQQKNPIKLGAFITRQKGVCAVETMILKVILDELQMESCLVSGVLDGTPHLWVTKVINGIVLIFDPATATFGQADQTGYIAEEDQLGTKATRVCEILTRLNELVEPQKEERKIEFRKDVVKLYEELLEIDKAAFGNNHPLIGVTYYRIGRLKALNGEHPQVVIELAEKCLGVGRSAKVPSSDPLMMQATSLRDQAAKALKDLPLC